MAEIYTTVGWWAAILFALPLATTRGAYARVVEVRDMFTQTVRSLASAVDARDPFTAHHSERVQLIAVDIGQEMRCSETELQALEWGGLLHDVGKIGVPDSVLLKPGFLTKDERIVMNDHPRKGAKILESVQKLTLERTIILHHHEWYNGSGYPDGMIGEAIPKLARILHVADAFEAMTAARPYRMVPLTHAQALKEIHDWTGRQFDPVVVEAFKRTKWARDTGPDVQAPAPPVELIAQVAAMRARAASDSGARAAQ